MRSIVRPKTVLPRPTRGLTEPALGINLYQATAEQVETVKQAHVMLAQDNAMQQALSISQYDLVGAPAIDRSLIQERVQAADLRWIDRGSVAVMGTSSWDRHLSGNLAPLPDVTSCTYRHRSPPEVLPCSSFSPARLESSSSLAC